jgi:hypothetical protein
MADLICTLFTLILVTASLLYVQACDRLKGTRHKGVQP